MRESTEFLKAVSRNWRTPKERAKFVEVLRRNNAMLDQKIKQNRAWKSDTDEELIDTMASDLEPVVHTMRRKGEISGGARKILLSPTSHF